MALDNRTKELGNCIFNAADQLKAQDIRALDLTSLESYTDLVFILSGSSNRQVQAIADRVREDMAKIQRVRPLGIEGYETGEWVLVDFGDIIVHVFLDEKRPDYQLEEMWPSVNTLDGASIPKFLKKRSGDNTSDEGVVVATKKKTAVKATASPKAKTAAQAKVVAKAKTPAKAKVAAKTKVAAKVKTVAKKKAPAKAVAKKSVKKAVAKKK